MSGAITVMPQRPKMIDGTAASRSTTKASGFASRLGAYCVMHRATPIEIGTASSMAKAELSTVVQSRPAMPKAS